MPCQHDGLCFERSNASLYDPRVGAQLPTEVRPVFDREFAYGEAAGYVCSCKPGYEGEFLSFSDNISEHYVSPSAYCVTR